METLVLLHGAIGSKQQLQPLRELLQSHFDVHSLNFQGHGGESLSSEFSIPLFAANVLAYLDDRNIKQTHLFGYSMGGFVALYLGKHHSNRVNKIATLATKFLWTEEIAQKEAQLLNASKIKEKLPTFAELLARRHYPQNWEIVLDKTARLLLELGKANCISIKELKQISIPTLVAVGDNDAMVTLEETITAYRALINANLWIMPNTQHPIEKVDLSTFAQGLIGFFSKKNNRY